MSFRTLLPDHMVAGFNGDEIVLPSGKFARKNKDRGWPKEKGPWRVRPH
jgi:hypothetical protein